MDDLTELLRPSWGSEKWILEGWRILTQEEKNLINQRMESLFHNGLPFELKHDKQLYIYTFSLLAQLEVLAIQIPLKFGPKMVSADFQARMRIQLLDEIFHGLVFTKILYLLCAPLALPPAYNDNIEVLCNFLRNEECPKMALMLLNLVSEGWIEEVFYSLQRNDIAPEVFTTIVEDEHRHVSEADLYKDIGMPDLNLVKEKLTFLENQLLSNIFGQYKYMMSLCTLLGAEGAANFIQAIHHKHQKQLKKIRLQPTPYWDFFMRFCQDILSKIENYSANFVAMEMTPLRRVLMTQWDSPRDPTMSAQCELDISALDFFNKKFPSETLTCLMMQVLSKVILEQDIYRSFLSYKRLYYSKVACIGLVVKLPKCQDHLGTIVLENCHTMPINYLFLHIRKIIKKMVYCYHKRAELEALHPHLNLLVNPLLDEWSNDFYEYPLANMPFVSLSNIQSFGYKQCTSPLRSDEALKFTLLDVEKKLVWDKQKNEFVSKDILPIALSADHRLLDGNINVLKMIEQHFNELSASLDQPPRLREIKNEIDLKGIVEYLCTKNVEMAYRALYFLQTYWFDSLSPDKLLNTNYLKMAYFSEKIMGRKTPML